MIKRTYFIFEKYRENGFTSVLINTKEIATEMKIDVVFRNKCQLRRKKQFYENDYNEIDQTFLSFYLIGRS